MNFCRFEDVTDWKGVEDGATDGQSSTDEQSTESAAGEDSDAPPVRSDWHSSHHSSIVFQISKGGRNSKGGESWDSSECQSDIQPVTSTGQGLDYAFFSYRWMTPSNLTMPVKFGVPCLHALCWRI